MERTLRKTLQEGKFARVSPERRQLMRSIPSRNCRSTERKFRMTLVRLGIIGWKLHPVGLSARPDVYFPQQKLAVFLDGCFWHGCPRCGHIPTSNQKFWSTKFALNKARDRRDTARLRRNGVRVLRLWEHELLTDGWITRLINSGATGYSRHTTVHRPRARAIERAPRR